MGGAQDRRLNGAHRCAVLHLAGAQDAGGDGPMRIEAHGLHVHLGRREVLRGLDFVAHAGEMTAVIGPNGAGKTTLLKALAGLLAPSAGTVSLEGCALAGWLPRARARALAYLPQERITHWALSARAVVALGRLPHQPMGASESPADGRAIDAALAAMDIGHLAARPVSEMSGGERTRVLIARALAQELAARFCHRIVLMQAGRRVAAGAAEDVLTREHLAAVYGIAAQYTRIGGIPVVLVADVLS